MNNDDFLYLIANPEKKKKHIYLKILMMNY